MNFTDDLMMKALINLASRYDIKSAEQDQETREQVEAFIRACTYLGMEDMGAWREAEATLTAIRDGETV